MLTEKDAASAPPASSSPAERRAATLVIATVIALYGCFVRAPRFMHLDHIPFDLTLERMRAGQGYFPAFRDSFLEMGVRLGGPRSFRQPLPFLVWRWVPEVLLYPFFLVAVVGATSFCFLRLARRAWAVVPVTLFLLVAARNPPSFEIPSDDWLLVEFWTIPLLAASSLAWRRSRWGIASGALAAACLIRELALPALVTGLVLAHRRRLPLRPWLIGLAVTAAGMAAHVALALQVGVARGNESDLFGSGHPPESVLKMLLFSFDSPWFVGAAIWALALFGVRRLPVEPVTALYLLPLLGFFFDRPYWGLMATPFAVSAAGDVCGQAIVALRRLLRAASGAGVQAEAMT